MSYRLDMELSDGASVSTATDSAQPKRQFLKEWPTEEQALTLMRFFRLVEWASATETIPDMLELMAEFERTKAAAKGHPRFGGVEVGLVSRREIRGVAEAIRLAARNLRDQADYLESSK